MGITLVAAVLHAVWNAIAHGIADRLVGFALIGAAYTVVGGATALVLGLPPAAAWPFVVASALVHVIYTLLLWASYQLGDFSQVYPVARGTAPLVVAVIEVVLGHVLPVWQLAGIVVISLGLISLALDRGRLSRAALPALGAAVATGVSIAGYTVIDAGAVATTPVLVYAAWMFLLQGPVMPADRAPAPGAAGLRRAPVLVAGLGGGVVSLAAYGLVLVAQTSGATAAVAALRETSIVIGAVIGAVFLGERFGTGRVVAAAVVARASSWSTCSACRHHRVVAARRRWAVTLTWLPQACIEHQRRLPDWDSSTNMREQSGCSHSLMRLAGTVATRSIASRASRVNALANGSLEVHVTPRPPRPRGRLGTNSGPAEAVLTVARSSAGRLSPARAATTIRWIASRSSISDSRRRASTGQSRCPGSAPAARNQRRTAATSGRRSTGAAECRLPKVATRLRQTRPP